VQQDVVEHVGGEDTFAGGRWHAWRGGGARLLRCHIVR
jgi:hypothetical protein